MSQRFDNLRKPGCLRGSLKRPQVVSFDSLKLKFARCELPPASHHAFFDFPVFAAPERSDWELEGWLACKASALAQQLLHCRKVNS